MANDNSEERLIEELQRGGTIYLGSRTWRKVEGPLAKGDKYFAPRILGPVILTVWDIINDRIIPEEPGYVYDAAECVKVEEV